MFVRSLRLLGFKSFAETTVLELEPGLNVIVGPNGSGKSNLADAIAWVLGSQAPTSLRGASMEDVIFAGSGTRARLDVAEVELTLDNSSGGLPLELSEATVGRFADRTGASEYRINGTPCRLLDIQELLSEVGVGRTLHTVVGQGQLDQVLRAQPEERRAFVEEAAQIGKHRRRKDRSLRKIERVDDNLTRLGDVLAELRRSLRPLRRQASVAAQHSELVAEHQALRQSLAATDLQRLQLDEAERSFADQAKKAELARDELAGVRSRMTLADAERDSAGAAAEGAQRIAHGIARATDVLAGLGRVARERAARLDARLAAETEEGYRERIALLEQEHRRWTGEAAAREEVAGRARRRAAELAAGAETYADRLRHADREVAAARARETAAAQAVVRAEGSEAAGRATIGSHEARVAAVVQRRRSADADLRAEGGAIERARDEVATLERQVDETTEAAARAEAALEEQREEEERVRDRLNVSGSARAAARARLEVLEEVAALLADAPAVAQRLVPLLADARERMRLAGIGYAEAEAILTEARRESEQLWSGVLDADARLRRHEALLSAAADRLAAARRRHDRREIELAALDDELARVRDALADAERAAVEERAALPVHRASWERAAAALKRQEEVAAEARRRAQEGLRAATDAEADARASEERALAARQRLEEAEAGLADARTSLEGLAELRDRLRRDRDRIAAVAEAAAAAAARGAAWSESAERRADEARASARAADERTISLRRRERELEQGLEAAERLRSELEVRRAEMRARAEAVAERAMDEWGLTVPELRARQVLNPVEEEEARARVHELEGRMRRLGPVNPQAAEDCRRAEERERFLVSQIEDLHASKRDLLAIVRDIDDTIAGVFSRAYTEVAAEFEHTFERLFPGGRGRLKLTDESDLLSSGIEIEARPPNKNVKKLSLLSGGERSLVALAFLLAIFRTHPSPFYLLDEVEAALDDINLQRFITLIRELEERAQVLIVTHQKRTMEAADILYGVTMGPDGVSQVVARRMQEPSASNV